MQGIFLLVKNEIDNGVDPVHNNPNHHGEVIPKHSIHRNDHPEIVPIEKTEQEVTDNERYLDGYPEFPFC